ncbi:MAG: single-stranded DNA-binding protein [Deltaproteobacteria bacterium]|jgi:single-stranded DNA-binding protein|nr:single-stranded DNA-binding protein [Deltaproteobacteria bacterium]
MSYDKNECIISGKVEGFTIVNTKTGTPMIKFRVCCNKEQFVVVAFKELADATRLNDGDPVSITGAIQTTSWEGKDGVKRYGFQIIASRINDNEREPFPKTGESSAPTAKPGNRAPVQPYTGGPF